MDGGFEPFPRTEFLDELDGCPHGVERGNFQNSDVIESGDNAIVLIFGKQGFQHGTGLWAVLGEHIALAHVVGAGAPCQRRLVEGDMANQVEGVQVFADFFHERIEE